MMHRYPGPRSFTGDDRHLFFGRDAEKQELFRLIVLNDLVVLFGESGCGKTSLLQAGVCPDLEAQQYKPVFIRLNNTDETPELQVCHQLKEGGYIPADMPEDHTLWEYFSRFWYVDLGEVYKPVIVFDQFEELFTLYQPEQRAAFIEQFAAIANRRPPAGLSPEAAAPPQAKFIFSLRSDFLYLLDELSADIPAILRCRFSLRLLDRDRAEAAITRPAAMPGDYVSPSFGYSAAALEGILVALERRESASVGVTSSHPVTTETSEAVTQSHRLTMPASIEIAAFQLQLVCRHLEEKIIRQKRPAGFSITPNFYGGGAGIRQIIEDFYHQVIEKISPAEREAVEKLLARGLIRNGRRIMMEASAMRDEYGVSQAALELLHDERLLKREARKGELYYEISHDTLVKPVLERFKKIEEAERAAEAERLRQQAVEDKRRLDEAERLTREAVRGRKRARVFAWGVGLAALLAVGAAVWAFSLKNRAQDAEAQTQTALAKSERLVNAFYFYADRFALAYGERKVEGSNKNVFYFINKNGGEVEKLSRWEKAEQFDERGFAKVKKSDDSRDYLLDTLGNAYPVAYEMGTLRLGITALDLSEKKLEALPKEIFQHPQLKILLLNDNQLSVLPAQIKELKNLTTLNLHRNRLSTLPAQIRELKNLKELDLSGNQLSALPAQIWELKNLIILNLSGGPFRLNQLSVLPAEIGELKNLTVLDFSQNQLSVLPAEIGELKNLTVLDLGYNELSTLPAQIWELKNLTMLDLNDNQLSVLPAEIGELKSLKELDLNFNRLSTLPAQIRELKNLKELDLSGNQLSALPTEIRELKNLTVLDFSQNQLSVLPAQIGELKNLIILNLSGGPFRRNQLSTLPAQIGELKNLTVLDLGYNELSVLPAQIEGLKNLTHLDLSGNQLSVLPTEIGELKNLTVLDFSQNQLSVLPAQIGELKNLTVLDLGYNELSTLPNQIGELKNLTVLDLGYNELSTLPNQIGDLKNLGSLYLWNNPISEWEQKNLQRLLPGCFIIF